MSCEKYERLISLYIDEELEQEEQAELEDHLARCPECQEELDILRSIISDLKSLESIEPPEGFHKNLMEKIHLESRQNMGQVIPLPLSKKKWYKNMKIASAVAAVFIFSVILIKPLKTGLFKDQMPEMVSMEEGQNVDHSITEPPAIKEAQEEVPDILDQSSADLPAEASISVAQESSMDKEVPGDKSADSQIDLAKLEEDVAQVPAKKSAEDLPAETPTKTPEAPKVKPAQEEIMPASHEPRIFRADRLPEERWTLRTPNSAEDAEYIIGQAEKLELDTDVTEIIESETQIITIAMTISPEQIKELESQMAGLEITIEAADYNMEAEEAQTIQLIIIVKERL